MTMMREPGFTRSQLKRYDNYRNIPMQLVPKRIQSPDRGPICET